MVDEGKLEETEDDKEKEIWKNHQILPSGPISIDVSFITLFLFLGMCCVM
jgi:hypothetical protein